MARLEPFFFRAAQGHLFCQHFVSDAAEAAMGSVVMLPPFAEEMNKSRRMLAQQAWRLAECGYSVYLLDLFGTGDSEGDLGDATWEGWLEDVRQLLSRVKREGGAESVSVLALRMGALLLNPVFEALSASLKKVVLWQPQGNGELLLNQFYRLKLAADMMGASAERMGAKEIKAELAAGNSVEIAGYVLNPELVSGLSNAKLEHIKFPPTVEVMWGELMATADRDITPASAKLIDRIEQSGCEITLEKVVGAQFWSAVELVDVPQLLDATTDFLARP